MKIIMPQHQIVAITPEPELAITTAARVCYQSHSTKAGSDAKLLSSLIKRGHHTPLEFANLTVRFIIDRGIANELVRHRIPGYCQESTRWVNYSHGKFNNELVFVKPHWSDDRVLNYSSITQVVDGTEELSELEISYLKTCCLAEMAYLDLIDQGMAPGDARGCLPIWLKTEIMMTTNFREMRLILSQRTSKTAHKDMQLIMNSLKADLQERHPLIFGEI
jgi:thymidylate synthase (FAD)